MALLHWQHRPSPPPALPANPPVSTAKTQAKSDQAGATFGTLSDLGSKRTETVTGRDVRKPLPRVNVSLFTLLHLLYVKDCIVGINDLQK